MAQKTTVRLVDDLDGSDAVETIAFGLGGKTYEIDLSAVNARKFRAAMGEFVKAARVVKRRPGRKFAVVESSGSSAARAPRSEAQEKRAWLAANGFPKVAGRRGRFTVEEDAAWERHVAGQGAEVVEEAATVADTAPEEAPGERTREGKQDAAGAPQEEAQAPEGRSGTRTRVSGLTGMQSRALTEELPELVVENGSTWSLLAGNPDEIIEAINAKRQAGVGRGTNNALASVVRKLTKADPKHVKVA